MTSRPVYPALNYITLRQPLNNTKLVYISLFFWTWNRLQKECCPISLLVIALVASIFLYGSLPELYCNSNQQWRTFTFSVKVVLYCCKISKGNIVVGFTWHISVPLPLAMWMFAGKLVFFMQPAMMVPTVVSHGALANAPMFKVSARNGETDNLS